MRRPHLNNVLKKHFFLFFVFVTGGAMMMIEMASFRLMTPYFGASLFIWGAIIGFFMVALSLGYYFGGRIADAYPYRKVLMGIVMAAGALLGFTPLLSELLIVYFVRGGFYDRMFLFGSATSTAIIFFQALFMLPVMLLGMVSPFVTRLSIRELEKTGNTAGSIYAFSTVGSVLGTFASSFVTIPLFGVKETMLIAAVSLLAVAFLGLIKQLPRSILMRLGFMLIVGIAFMISSASMSFGRSENMLYQKDSFYGRVEVLKDDALGVVLDINRSGRWSVYHPNKMLTGFYFDYFLPFYYMLDKKSDIDVLILGSAGGVISRQYAHYFGDNGVRIDGVELDPEVTKAAYRFFGLGQQKNVTAINDDGRIYLEKNPKRYDLIFTDVFASDLYIPYQMATKEFYESTYVRLSDGGIFSQMIIAGSPNERIFKCVSQTMKSVYPYVYFFPDGKRIQYLLAGSRAPLNDTFAALRNVAAPEELMALNSFVADEGREILSDERPCIFTDNWAPTELFAELDEISRGYR
ncbi:MAG: hypothetical protein A2939_00140 [Parcubacteria group bacterium RIFCSPLOWO2_01_FULL_48_18]|nr:MAG: hypothetical protein A3J67_05905 [Parcubacteria group bacterium RIFCSPHIGHO2_02_FULL_48_10b]OHB22175.1 MAG: hypothetical protein A2939_00140 [Parcubacteria group bacterium RIFCSPLOWO2_01_FULL_48_18]